MDTSEMYSIVSLLNLAGYSTQCLALLLKVVRRQS